MNILKVVKFIKGNPDWEKILSEKPYCIGISRDSVFGRNLIIFKYSQIDSDFNNEIVRECRGLVLDEDTLEPVVVPFFKFGNYGEGYAPDIDWKSARVTEKIDGSLIKVVRIGDDILISTNGTIDAFKANLETMIGCDAKNFGELAIKAIESKMSMDEFKALIKPGITYMFELTSPFNKIVVQWHSIELHFLGARDNFSLQEFFFNEQEFDEIREHFTSPATYPLGTLDECIAATEKMGIDKEGYVVVDKFFNRVKIKSPTYVALHHMRGNGNLSYSRGIEVVRKNEIDELVTYFPEFKEHLEKIKDDYDSLVNELEASWDKYCENHFDTRKDSAQFIIKNFRVPAVGFIMLDKKISSVKEWADSIASDKMCEILGYK